MATATDFIICSVSDSDTANCTDRQYVGRYRSLKRGSRFYAMRTACLAQTDRELEL